MTDDKTPAEHRFGRVDSNRRNVLKLPETGVGLSVGSFSAGSALASPTANSVTVAAEPGVDPQTVSVQLAPDESTTVEKTVTTPEIPPQRAMADPATPTRKSDSLW